MAARVESWPELQVLLAEVRGGGVAVVVGDLAVAGGVVEGDGVGLLRSRVEPYARVAEAASGVLEGAQQSTCVTAAAGVGDDEHPLDLGDAIAQSLHAATAHGLTAFVPA